MQLPTSMRDNLVDELDEYLEAFSAQPDPEAVAAYVIELLETFADEAGIDDIIAGIEEGGTLDGTLQETLEAEMASNDEFEYTGEEVVSLLERLSDIDWSGGDNDDDDDSEEEEEEEEEELN